jgi:hypothetical protein
MKYLIIIAATAIALMGIDLTITAIESPGIQWTMSGCGGASIGYSVDVIVRAWRS